MFVRVFSITRKEHLHIVRDPRTLVVMFLIPLVQPLLLGCAATTDVKHLPTAILDRDRTLHSRQLVDTYRASGYFDIIEMVGSEAEMALAVDSDRVQAGLAIPAGYERALARGEKVKVGFVIDGSHPSVASTAHGSVSLLLGLTSTFLLASLGLGILISTVYKTQQEAMLAGEVAALGVFGVIVLILAAARFRKRLD
jgi:ABC-2 type transport system permease protein